MLDETHPAGLTATCSITLGWGDQEVFHSGFAPPLSLHALDYLTTETPPRRVPNDLWLVLLAEMRITPLAASLGQITCPLGLCIQEPRLLKKKVHEQNYKHSKIRSSGASRGHDSRRQGVGNVRAPLLQPPRGWRPTQALPRGEALGISVHSVQPGAPQ